MLLRSSKHRSRVFRLVALIAGIYTVSSSARASNNEMIEVAQPTWQNTFFVSADNEKFCSEIQAQIAYIRKQIPTVHCSIQKASEEKFKASGSYKFSIKINKSANEAPQLVVENWSPDRDDTDFEVIRHTLNGKNENENRFLIQRHLENLFEADKALRFTKEGLLASGLKASERLILNDRGSYVDRNTGRQVDFEKAYKIYKEESPKQKYYLRAIIELFALVGPVGSTWYWRNQDFNAVDWMLKWDWEGWRRKIVTFDALRFDANAFDTNAVKHPFYAGFSYYIMSRTNNLNILESALFSTLASALWEYLVEFKEFPSLNDIIATPLGGLPLGEVYYQLGEFFNRGGDHFVNRTLSYIFGGPRKFHDWLSKQKVSRTGNVDRYGFSRDIWHKFQLFGSAGEVSPGTPEGKARYEVGLETEIINIPEYGKPGAVSRIVTDGNFTKLLTQLTMDKDGVQSFTVFARAALAGYYRQNTSLDSNGLLNGYSFYVGVGSAYDYSVKKFGGIQDNMAIVNVMGPSIDLTYFYKGAKVRATIHVFGDFGMVTAYAGDAYYANHPRAGTNTAIALQDYYYAFGVTVSPELSASYKGLEFGGQLKFERFESIDSRDLKMESITDHDFHASDRRFGYKLWAAYTFPGDFVKLVLSLDHVSRGGTIKEVTHEAVENTLMASLVFVM